MNWARRSRYRSGVSRPRARAPTLSTRRCVQRSTCCVAPRHRSPSARARRTPAHRAARHRSRSPLRPCDERRRYASLMTAAALLALIAVGFAVGFLAGLVGIGGGVLIVPFLYFFYAHAAWSGVSIPPDLHATVAHATSLFIIVPTALAGTATYARNGLVAWRTALPVALFSMAFAAVAAALATRMSPQLLKVAVGTFLLLPGIQLLTRRASSVSGLPRENLLAAGATGILVGIFSALLGVGGGLVAIPMLMYVVRLDIRYVAATSLAIVAFAATAGTLTYMFT